MADLNTAVATPREAMVSDDVEQIFRFALDGLEHGVGCALVTLVAIDGGAARSIGAHMAIRADGAYCSYVSGGCVEGVVATEAVTAIHQRRDRSLILGKGSPYFDITLPCGGGITLAIHVLRDGKALSAVLSALDDRQRICTAYDSASETLQVCRLASRSGWEQKQFLCAYRPRPQIVLCGGMLELAAIARLSEAAGYRTLICTDSRQFLNLSAQFDQDTAIALLFHNIEKEVAVFDVALASPAFYIGALGSHGTHARRCEELTQRGHSRPDISRIKAPIGIFPKARDSSSLALSILAEIAANYASA
jgi:xanthine dehydrogenase accessory factor